MRVAPWLTFTTKRAGSATVALFDVSGRLVRRVLDEPMLEAGTHDVRLLERSGNGKPLASGIYFVRVSSADGDVEKRVAILKKRPGPGGHQVAPPAGVDWWGRYPPAGRDRPMSESQDRTNDEAAIRRLVEDWASSVRRRDLDGILRHHSADIVMFDVPPPIQSRGIEAYRTTWDAFFSWSRDPTVFDIKEMTVTAGSDVAFVTALMLCAGTEASGVDIQLDFRLTIGLRKISNQWTITHEHHSIPATQ
jgi:ketosteroid isomerase-like protein